MCKLIWSFQEKNVLNYVLEQCNLMWKHVKEHFIWNGAGKTWVGALVHFYCSLFIEGCRKNLALLPQWEGRRISPCPAATQSRRSHNNPPYPLQLSLSSNGLSFETTLPTPSFPLQKQALSSVLLTCLWFCHSLQFPSYESPVIPK